MASIIILSLILVFDLLNYLLMNAAINVTVIIGVVCLVGIVATIVLPKIKSLKEKKITPFLPIIVLVLAIVLCSATLLITKKSDRIARISAMDEICQLIDDGKYDKASIKLDSYEGLYGGNDTAYYNRAVIYIYQGKAEQAREYLDKVSFRYRDVSADWHYAYSEVNEMLERDYVDNLKKAISINPNHYEALVKLGNYCLYNDPDCFKSLYYLQSAIRLNETDPGSLLALAHAYLNVNDYSDAKTYLDFAVKYSNSEQFKKECDKYYQVIAEEGGNQ